MALVQVGVAQRFCSLWVGGGRWLQEVVGEADAGIPTVISRCDATRGPDAKGSVTTTALLKHERPRIHTAVHFKACIANYMHFYFSIVQRYV